MSHDHNHDPNLGHHFDTLEQQFESGKLGMWLFLVTEVLMFGGLFALYALYRANHFEIYLYAHKMLDWKLGGLNTAILLASSFTMALGVRAAQLGNKRQLCILLFLTLFGGVGFFAVKSVEYNSKFSHGIKPGRWNVYYPIDQGSLAAWPKGDKHYPQFSGQKLANNDKFWEQHGLTGEKAQLMLIDHVEAYYHLGKYAHAHGDSHGHGHDDHGHDDHEHGEHGKDGHDHSEDHADHAAADLPIATAVANKPADHDHADLHAPVKVEAVPEIIPVTGVRPEQAGSNAAAIGESAGGLSEELQKEPETDPGLLAKLGAPDVASKHHAIAFHPAIAGTDPHVKILPHAERDRLHLFFNIYYVMTGLHALHVAIGMGVILWLLILALKGRFSKSYYDPVDIGGLYWHLVDLIWIFLFPLLYLIH